MSHVTNKPIKTYNFLTQDLLKLVRKYVSMRPSLICRHSVALDLLSLMELNNLPIPEGLIEAVVKNSEGDEEASRILCELFEIV